MSLREITKDLHTQAEHTHFAKALVKGNLTKDQYANYLFQLIPIYGAIEFGCSLQGFLDKLPDIKRTSRIYTDYLELADGHTHIWLPSTLTYVRYLQDLINDLDNRQQVKAHMYVRHMGDLHGGQFIAKNALGAGRMYQFEDLDNLKVAIRNELTDDLGDEARVAFEFAIAIMNELDPNNV